MESRIAYLRLELEERRDGVERIEGIAARIENELGGLKTDLARRDE